MQVLDYKSTDGAQQESGAAYGIDAHLGFHLAGGFWVKGLESQAAQLSGLAAAGSWGFSGANLNLVAEFVSLELAGVHGSGVVSTGRNRSPRADSFTWSNDGQRVSDIDVNDFVPADRNRGEWIRENHAFVEDFNFWSNENQVRSNAAGYGPQGAGDGGQGFIGQPERHSEQRAKGKNQPSQNVATTGSKTLSITHVSIIAGDK